MPRNNGSHPIGRVPLRRRARRSVGRNNVRPQNGSQTGSSIVRPAKKAPLQNVRNAARNHVSPMTSLRGSDFLTTLKVKGTNEIVSSADRILLRQPVSASSFKGTRVSQLSQLWERYMWQSLAVRYVAAVPNTIACQLIAYLDTDPLDDASSIPDVDGLLRQAVAQAGSRQWNFNSGMTIPLAIRKDGVSYFTGDDKQNERLSLQGVLYIIQVTDLVDFNGVAAAAGITAGSLYIDWSVLFGTPQINPVAVGADLGPERELTEFSIPWPINTDVQELSLGGITPGANFTVGITGSGGTNASGVDVQPGATLTDQVTGDVTSFELFNDSTPITTVGSWLSAQASQAGNYLWDYATTDPFHFFNSGGAILQYFGLPVFSPVLTITNKTTGEMRQFKPLSRGAHRVKERETPVSPV